MARMAAERLGMLPMTKPGRLACVNPSCNRTASAEKFGEADIICAKCWKLLPQALRNRYRQLRSRETRLLKLIGRRLMHHDIAPEEIIRIEHRQAALCAENWQLMRDYFRHGDKPVGLEGFLQEMGM